MFELNNVKNIRSLSYLKNKEGFYIKNLIRSGNLSNINNNDIINLKNNNVNTIIDFRMHNEINNNDVYSLFNYYNFEIKSLDSNYLINKVKNDKLFSALDYINEFYISLLNEEAYKSAFKKMLSVDGAILWHCGLGKDRTGVFTILILLLLDVDILDIKRDFIMSNDKLNNEFSFILENIYNRHNDIYDNAKNIFLCNEKSVDIIYEYIIKNYNSVYNFFKQCFNFNDLDILCFKKKFLDRYE